MSRVRCTTPNEFKSNFDEVRWVIQIRDTLNEVLEDDDQFPVSIFNVPKTLMATDPDSYIPQQVSIGPYHCWRQELYEMERYKISSAKRFQEQLQNLKLEHIVHQLMKLEERIRACYHRYLNFNGETLMWMVAIDASFLLEFLQVYTIQDETMMIPGVSSRMSHLMDYAGRRIAHNAILKDIVMLENQIPLFVLRKMLEFKFSSTELADDMLVSMLIGLFKQLSPFKVIQKDCSEINVSECAHLLDFLYSMAVPKLDEQSDVVQLEDHQHKDNEDNEESFLNYAKKFLCKISSFLSKLATTLVNLIKKFPNCRTMKVITWLPWTIISNLPGVGLIKQPVEYLFFSEEKEARTAENGNLSSDNGTNKPPLMEEIAIPSVTELSKAGVCFMATNGDISTIGFDVETVTLYLPTIGLDLNSEVILRNLVAYEASTASGSLVFTRYTELMNGIIDYEEDAKILREKGVILNHLKSDEEVATLWNGMTKSIKLTRVPFLDKVIEDVNQHYNGRICIKVLKFMKLYVFASWQFLIFLAAIFLLLLMSLQVFCSFYKCNRRNRVTETK
ncbi:hypothetical protein LR48_Vigan03g003700 [Vigna angularis]|uniref:Putative UPF0481 protein n=1 Tax=Phaseolus angularis TaxID=3914 RepID=A0A0L9U1L5_PHAAN|nr:putative UPF0481 protein At3g02645 [Vigna angularis]KAG2403938.1 putative UPF0481 protein [Vigna angularis]KOM36656.1 hypothetical protein LR48_Vigan03g003700 [Vigna angularis]